MDTGERNVGNVVGFDRDFGKGDSRSIVVGAVGRSIVNEKEMDMDRFSDLDELVGLLTTAAEFAAEKGLTEWQEHIMYVIGSVEDEMLQLDEGDEDGE